MTDELFNFYRNALGGALCEPLCDEYRHEWRAAGQDAERLVALSLRGQAIPYFATYCNQGKGLSKQYLLSNFGKYVNGHIIHDADGVQGYTYALYVDWRQDDDITAEIDVMHVMYTTGATVLVPATKCPTIYVSNGSDISIACEGFNSVKLYVFDNSRVTIDYCDDDCSVTAFEYSEQCRLEKGRFCLGGKIKEHQKQLRL